jgi:hypothetical protein
MRKQPATSPKRASASPKSEQKPVADSVSGDCTPNGKVMCDESVRLHAYLKWETAGKPAGDGVRFWGRAQN